MITVEEVAVAIGTERERKISFDFLGTVNFFSESIFYDIGKILFPFLWYYIS